MPDEMRKAKLLIEESKRMEERYIRDGLSDVERMTCHALNHDSFIYSIAHAEAWANQILMSAKFGLFYMWGSDEHGRDIQPPAAAQEGLVGLAKITHNRPDALTRWNQILDVFGQASIDSGSGVGQDFKLCIKVNRPGNDDCSFL